jgi:signal transduction histidine kinase
VANVVYLLLGSRTGFFPLFLAALMAGWGLASRIGPTSFFNRLLRREMLDYERVVDFNHRVVEAQDVKTLMQVATDSLSRLLETENIWVWLVNEERHTLEVYENGQKTNRMLLPAGFVDRLSNQPAPLYAGTTAASPFDLSAPAGAVDDVAVWVPLVERGQAVGMMGLGPRWTGELYDEQDIQLVGILAQQLTLSVLNSHYIKHLQASTRLIRTAEEKERLKIARELHDTILQFLLVLKVCPHRMRSQLASKRRKRAAKPYYSLPVHLSRSDSRSTR